ncbi:MAG: hypothetical protein FWC46_01095, partial [Actinomycetia bacterium]|nr:hypothetical protein [Actinomycetes bacterium]
MSSPVSALLTGSPQPKASFHLVFIAGSLLFFAVFFVGMGAVISPLYPGPAATTTGTIVSSPTSWPVVAYTVDGVAYEVKTKENDPSRQVGQQLTMLYNPGHPTQASTVSSRRVTQAFAGVAFACLAGGAVLFVRAFRARARARWAVVHGTRFQATITGVSQNPMV